MKIAAFFALVALTAGSNYTSWEEDENQLPHGLTCSRNAQYVAFIDGIKTTVKCTYPNADPAVRCAGCCAIKALAAGLQTTNAAAFTGVNGRDCICCINNDHYNHTAYGYAPNVAY